MRADDVQTRPRHPAANSCARKNSRRKTARLLLAAIEPLEPRRLLNAHVAGSSTVYTTIQAAVNAAPANGIVTVDPGTYNELVSITKTLTVRGPYWGQDARYYYRGVPGNEATVDGATVSDGQTSAFYINANDVTIDGFTIQNQTSQSEYGAGIYIHPGVAGIHVLNNIVRNNITGIYLANNSSSDAALIQHNVFNTNNQPGNYTGRAIYSDQSVSGGLLTNVTIDGNTFYKELGDPGTSTGLEAAIGLESTSNDSQTNVSITNNVFTSNGKAALLDDVVGLTVSHNIFTGTQDTNSGTLRFEGGDQNVTITNNTFWGNSAPAIHVDYKTVSNTNKNFVANNNNFYNNTDAIVMGGGEFSGTFNANNNWWGASTGPGGDFSGAGDKVLANGDSITVTGFSSAPQDSAQFPFYGVPNPAAAPIQAVDFDNGGEGVAYHDTDTANTGGQYRPEGVDITTIPNSSPYRYAVTNTQAGEWIEYTINVPTTGNYNLDLQVGSQGTGGNLSVSLQSSQTNGADLTGPMTIPNTGAPTTWTHLIQTVSLNAGIQTLRVNFLSVGSSGITGDFNALTLTPTSTITPAICITNQNPAGWNTASPISGAMSVQWWNGSNNTVTQRAVLGIRDASGNWVGGAPQIIDTATPPSGSPGQTDNNRSFSNLSVPTTSGSYTIWASEIAASSDAAAISAFEAAKTTASDQTDQIVGQLTVPAASESPYLGSPFNVGDLIQAEDFNNGGEGIAYHDTDAVNQGGQFRSTGVDVETTSDTNGGYDVGWVQPTEWLDYSINVATSGTYTINARVASNVSGGQFHYALDGTALTSQLNVPNTAGWQNWTTLASPQVTLSAGPHVLRVLFDTAPNTYVGNFNYFQINPVETPYHATPFNIGDTIQAEDFDNGGEGIAYHDTDAINQGGQYRSTGVDVETTSDTGGGYDVGYTHAGEWLQYTINVAATGIYTLSARVASPLPNAAFHLSVDGAANYPSLAIPNTGAWQSFQTMTQTGISLTAGIHVLRIAFDTNNSAGYAGNFNWFSLS